MDELTVNEIKEVNGGGLGFDVIAGGVTVYADGGELMNILVGAFMGGAGGMSWDQVID